jgi:DNA-directed RNA polymerase sigma subunit (sigma70/sigma32)
MELRAVREVADRLAGRERAVIRAHYGLDQPAQTFDQIGETLGLTAERARQIEAGALTSMRAALAEPATVRRPSAVEHA